MTKKIYSELVDTAPLVPPEIGGIIGTHNICIDEVAWDIGKKNNKGMYIPNIVFLNEKIKEWQKRNISFCGIYHTHAKQWNSLSSVDREYITKIMRSMPSNVSHLYFPIVFPRDSVIVYIAIKHRYKIDIATENIKII